MAHEALKAQVGHLRHGIEQLDAEVNKLEGTLQVVKADRQNMLAELDTLEQFLNSTGIPLPYGDQRGRP